MPSRLRLAPLDTADAILNLKSSFLNLKSFNEIKSTPGDLSKLPFDLIHQIFSEFVFDTDSETYLADRVNLLKVNKFFNILIEHPFYFTLFVNKYKDSYRFPNFNFALRAGDRTTAFQLPHDITDELMDSVIEKCPNLEKIYWYGTDVFKFLDKLVGLKKLKKINTRWIGSEGKIDKFSTLLQFTHLTELNLGRGKGDPEDFKNLWNKINQLQQLEKLSFFEMGASNDPINLFMLTPLTHLRKLALTKRHIDLEPSKNPFKSLTQLEKLNMAACIINDEFIQSMTVLKNLKSLNLKSCPITGVGLRALKELNNLQELSFGSASITNDDIQHISGLTQLTCLDLDGNEKITDNCFKTLSNLTKLKRMSLEGCFLISKEGLKIIATKFKNLTWLNIYNTSLKSRQCSMFTSFANLMIRERPRSITNIGVICIHEIKNFD